MFTGYRAYRACLVLLVTCLVLWCSSECQGYKVVRLDAMCIYFYILHSDNDVFFRFVGIGETSEKAHRQEALYTGAQEGP